MPDTPRLDGSNRRRSFRANGIAGRFRPAHLAAVSVTLIATLGSGCNGKSRMGPGSADYRSAVRAFFIGVAALQAGDANRAQQKLSEANRLAPDEPAALANLAILDLRGHRVDSALKRLAEARKHAPDDLRIVFLHALAKNRKGDFAGAEADYRTVIEKEPSNLRARYALMEQVQQSGGANADAESRRLLEEMARVIPDNLIVNLEITRLAVKQGDAEAAKRVVESLARDASGWPPEAKERFSALRASVTSGSIRGALPIVLGMKNLLMVHPKYRIDYEAVKVPDGELGDPLLRLIKLPNPPAAISAPDDTLAFAPDATITAAPADFVTVTHSGSEAKPVVVTKSGDKITVAGVADPLALPAGPRGSVADAGQTLVSADLNADYLPDLALAGTSGLRLYQQNEGSAYADVTAKTKLAPAVTRGSYRGLWSADVDMDGDLDLIASPVSGQTVVLRNNADGTFTSTRPFAGAASVAGFAWADLDDDGDSDAVLLDASGGLIIQVNDRAGQFRRVGPPAGLTGVAAIAALDSDDDGQLDVVALKQDGSLVRLARNRLVGDPAAADAWKVTEAGRWDGASGLKPGNAALIAADLDNNGGIDLLASGASESRIWLHGPAAAYSPLAAPVAAHVSAAADMNSDGRVDLLGVGADGKALVLLNQGKKSYRWQAIRPKAKTVKDGDQRINSFGVGGSVDIRAGFLAQRQIINSPVVHFGLGDNASIDAARFVWPNGQIQAEFELQPNQTVVTDQRLKGSCPWVFAWDGQRMAFVTDALWRSPLGLRINAQDTGPVAMTADWLRIPRASLAPRDGAYDIRITAELWETHFFDHVSLMAVDHPEGTEVWVDERFAIPPPKVGVILTKPSVPVERAVDDLGADVTATVRQLDGRYLDTFGRGRYQGVTREHYVEVELGADFPGTGRAYLIGQGWIHPTDSSINVAIAQGSHPKPQDLSLEVPDGRGGWRVAKPHLGFPAGKNKSIVIDLAGLFGPGIPKRLRLRTNLEIYWDRLAWAEGANTGARRAMKTRRWLPATADLRYRGYSATSQANDSSPELPDYENLAGTSPRWYDLEGFHTRFGDVRELLSTVDDRYVIMNAGDEMVFRFPVQPSPPAGFVRDFVLISDGWEKDGDLNTGFSKTVLPLPSHADPFYATPPSTLENDPVYRRHPRDWQTYHTRYITPAGYFSAFRTKVSP